MSVTAVCGLPGSGKSLFTSYLMVKHYKKMNRFKSKKKKVNCVYSNFPIKLDKDHYSKSIGLFDINLQHSWEPGSSIAIDEVQLYFDSLEFKEFPKGIRNAFQLHRHFGIKDIYVNSQHPSRIVKPVRVLISQFYDVVGFIKIPFTPFAIFRYNIYYNADDFGKSVKVKKSDVSYKFTKKILIINYKKVYKAYDTIYMNNLVSDKPKFDSPEFISKLMSKGDIDNTFGINDETDEVIKKKPKKAEKGREYVKSEISSFEDTESLDTGSILIEAIEDLKKSQQMESFVNDVDIIDDDKQAKSLHENDFIEWSPVGDKPTTDVFSLIDDIEKNDSNDKKTDSSSFWN